MAKGPGKYDHLCSIVRRASDARIAMVVIVGGTLGDGFSVQVEGIDTEDMQEATLALARGLESIAEQIRGDIVQ